MFFKILWNLISGNIAGIVTTITGYLGKLSDNEAAKFQAAVGADKDVAVAQLQTAANVYHDRVDLLKGLKVTQWLVVAALAPPLLHQGMVYLDSTPFPYITIHDWLVSFDMHKVGTWRVPQAPPPYDEREGLFIGSLLGIQGAVSTGLGAIKMLMRR